MSPSSNPTPTDTHTIDVNGQRLHVAIRPGDGRRTPLLLMSGIGANLELLQPFVDALDRTTEVLAATGGGIVLLADAERPERAAISGQFALIAENGLSTEQLDRAAERLERAVERCAERGLRAALHPHAATFIESEAETEAILERTSPELGLCVDTGHTVVGGADPIQLVHRHADRLTHLHLKDVDAGVLGRLRRGEIDMDEAWAEGIFCPFGEGVVPLAEFLALPEVRGLEGYAVLEQDRIAVLVDDLPAVRVIEERNLERVRQWLS